MEKQSITEHMLDKFSRDFQSHPQHRINMNAVIQNGISAASFDYRSPIRLPFTFSHEIETGKVTAQQQSGRCWMFAGLNTMRQRIIKKYELDNFELSQNYPMFWDKLEKANFFLESILDTMKEERDSRLVMWLLNHPMQDGGQWDMFVNLIEKYGVVPKYIMPETYHSSKSSLMNQLLTTKLREDAMLLRRAIQTDSIDTIRELKEAMLNEIYRMLCHFLGEPPQRFDFEFRDKNKKFHRETNLTPQEFYQKYIGVDLRQYVSLVNAPTDNKEFNQTYTVQYLGNVMSGLPILYLNVDNDILKQAALAQLKEGETIWFGCDMGKMVERDKGLMDAHLNEYSGTLNVSFEMTKGERLVYGESQLTHAMVFIGVNIKDDGQPDRWKVENSWGDDKGNQGFFNMSDDWFDLYLYQAVINKKYLNPEQLKALLKDPVVLPPWDPLGSLALMR